MNVVADQLGELARSLQGYRDMDEMLAEVVRAAVRLIPGVDEASISVVTDRRAVTSRFPSGGLPGVVDALQEQTGQGPCLEAVYEQHTVRVPDMSREQRWPLFAAQASQAGARSMLSIQLWVEGNNLGALNLFSRRVDAFDDESEQVGLLFASHASVAYAGAWLANQIRDSVATRDLIGQAKGILMERYKVTADQAFRMLVKVSNDNNVSLRSVAHDLAATGQWTVRTYRQRASISAVGDVDPADRLVWPIAGMPLVAHRFWSSSEAWAVSSRRPRARGQGRSAAAVAWSRMASLGSSRLTTRRATLLSFSPWSRA